MKIILPTKIEMGKLLMVDPEQRICSPNRYYSFLKFIYLKRFKTLLKLLGNNNFDKLLDVGFGSGIFLPTLKMITKKLYGVDCHPNLSEVNKMLTNRRVEVEIQRGSVTNLPYNNNQFDAITCLSVLEFVEDTDRAINEINRVAKPNSKIIIGAPVNNKITDFCYRIIGQKKQNKIHVSDHRQIINSINKYLKIEKIITIPIFTPLNYSLFFVLLAKKIKQPHV